MMSMFRRFLIATLVALFAFSNDVSAQTSHERALIEAIQSRDMRALHKAATAIERGVDAGLPVSSQGRTATFGLLGQAMFSLGDLDATLRYYKRAVDASWEDGLWMQSEGITARYEFANSLMLKNQHAEARPVIMELVRDLDRMNALRGNAGRNVLVSLSALFMEVEEWDNLEGVARDIIEFAQTARPIDKHHMMIGANAAAIALRAQKRASEAVPFARFKLQIAQELYAPNSEDTLTARVQLGTALQEAGQFVEARRLLEGVLADIPPNARQLEEVKTQALGRLARIDKAEGKYLNFRSRNRDVMEQLIASGTPEEKLLGMEHLANTLLAEGEFQTYLNMLREIIRLVDENPDLPQESGANARVKMVQFLPHTEGNFAATKALIDQAVTTLNDTLGPDHIDTLRAEVQKINLRRSEALQADRVREIGKELVFSNGEASAASFSDRDLNILRRHAEAEAKAKGPLNGMVHFLNYAGALSHVGRYGEALAVLDSQEDVDTKIVSGGATLDSYLGHMRYEARARVHVAAGNFEYAALIFEDGLTTLLSSLRELSWISAVGGTQKFHLYGQVYGQQYATAAWHAGKSKSAAEALPSQEHAFQAAQLAGYGPASAAVARPAVRRASKDPDLRQKISEFEALSRFNPVKTAGTSSEVLESAAKRRARESRLSQLHAEIDARFPEYFGLQIPDTVPLAEITGADNRPPLIASDEALIVVLPMLELKENKRAISGLVLAVTRENVTWAEMPVTFRQFAEDLTLLHYNLDPVGQRPEVLAASRAPLESIAPDAGKVVSRTEGAFPFVRANRLYKTIFGAPEIAEAIAGKSNWTIVPYGAALTVPYAALVTRDPGQVNVRAPEELRKVSWLGHEKALTMVPSISALKSLRTRAKAPRSATTLAYLGIGDPAFQGADDAELPSADEVLSMRGSDRAAGIRSLPRLPGTRREVKALAEFFKVGPEAVALGADATEEFIHALNARGDLRRARIVHIATHGLLSGAFQGLGEPALALTPPSNATGATSAMSDGLLTASEAAQLELNADWVILSACDTAGNEDVFGDGLGGLAQGFFSAGARSLLISQWRVDDRAAERLTTGTVTTAEKGVPKAEALRQTMRNLANDTSRDGAKISNAHPSIWAPFLLVGGG